jgi:hypothetical protein
MEKERPHSHRDKMIVKRDNDDAYGHDPRWYSVV